MPAGYRSAPYKIRSEANPYDSKRKEYFATRRAVPPGREAYLLMKGYENTLRGKLEEVFKARDWSEYLALLTEVTCDFPNGIKLLDSPYPIERYTCVVHVLDFTEKPEFLAMASWNFDVGIGPKFIHWMLEKELLTEVGEADARKSDTIIYFDQDTQIKHVGLWLGDGRVESKWGKGGLFQHGVFEVPGSYGTTIRFFSSSHQV